MSDKPVRPLIPSQEGRWWLDEQKDRRGSIIMQAAQKVWSQCEPARASMMSSWRLYSNQPLLGSGMMPRMYRKRNASVNSGGALSLNVVKAVSDTYVAMLTEDEPAVEYQTRGGSGTMQRRALALERFSAGIFHEACFYRLLSQVATDSALFPFGAVETFEDWTDPDEPRVAIERRRAWEYIADEQDAKDGNPRNPFMVRSMDRLVAMAKWPDKAEEILTRAASVSAFDHALADTDDGSSLADQIVVVTAWHLSSGKDDPGRKAIVTGDVVLYDEPYDRRTSGVTLLYRLMPTEGMWSSSLAEELKGIQREINVGLRRSQYAMHLSGSGHWLIHQNSNFNTNTLDNQQGSVWRWSGVKPEYFPGGSVPPEQFTWVWQLYQKAFEIIGVSMASAQGQTPQLNGSGKAILAYADVQSKRFKPSYRLLQDFTLEVAREGIGCARRIADKHKGFAINAPGKMMAAVKWADGNLADEEFIMQAKAVNKLADDPVGVMDQIQNLANAGPQYMSATAGRALMTEVPDLQAWASMMNAPYDLVNMIADKMLEKGKYIAPDQFLPLDEAKVGPDNAIAWIHLRLLKGQLDEEPEDRLDLLRRWLVEAEQTVAEMRKAAAPPPAALPPGASMGPQLPPPPGTPGAPPASPQAMAA